MIRHSKRPSIRSQNNAKWHRELKQWWAKEVGIEYCEVRFSVCVGSFGGALAHSKKRRFILTKEDYFEVCYACVKCHEVLDNKMSHYEMEVTVKEIIAKRNV